jgi:hypothetical protein
MILVILMWVQPPLKQEIETSIQKHDMPESALVFLESTLREADDIRYYKESDGLDVSYEVKFRLNGNQWSVEFDSSGAFEDAEQLVKLDMLSSEWQLKLRTHLDSRFNSWTATRVQLQFLTWPADLDHPAGIELIVEGQNSSEIGVFEFGFPSDDSGISERRVIEILDF